MLDTLGAHGYEPGMTLLLDRPATATPRVAEYLPRHAKESVAPVESQIPDVRLAAIDYLQAWYPSSHWRMRPMLSSFAYDGHVWPELHDELANELLDCPPDGARARDLVALARMIVEHLTQL